MSTEFPWPTKVYRSSDLRSECPSITDRQKRLENYDPSVLQSTSVLLIGNGGMGSNVALPLARKGIGRLELCDADYVEQANLCTQEYGKGDLDGAKPFRLAHRAANDSCLGTVIRAHHTDFQRANASVLRELVDIGICLVDNNHTRAVAALEFRAAKKPIVFAAVNPESDFGWVFVQEATGPCLGCVFPDMAQAAKQREPCRSAPAVIDILRVLSGIVLYAVDSLLLPRQRRWNYRSIHLIGGMPDCVNTVSALGRCGLCHT